MKYPFLKISFLIVFFLHSESISLDASPSVIPWASPIRGTASWYSENDPGVKKNTANTEIFDDSQLTCAMWDVPFNTRLKVTNEYNNKSVIVRVNDRGPAKRLVEQGRVIDLSKNAFLQIASLDQGIIPIHIEFLE
jgi:rare lipoprotein A